MGSRTGTWILLGLVAGVASLATAANVPQSDEQRILQNNGKTFLSNGAGQIIRGADGKTILIGSDGNRIVVNDASSEEESSQDYGQSNSNVIINGQSGSTLIQSDGHSYIYGDASQGSYINSNGRSLRIINGAIELNEHGQVYTFQPKAVGVNEKETVDINGQPAQVEYSNGDIVIELADHTVIAKIGGRTFLGDRYSFDNRDKLEAEAKNYAQRIEHEVNTSIQKSMEELNAELQRTLGNLFV
ncbi:uncharacterized protein LOC128254868 [Drosophila gunungcola]|uniref:CG18067 protein n=1 Tax=Drosophila gunungcola TaxID=103775 RepID=A0A9Q0BNY1_9MUSC|nr:uncharacterized protein LOC128254868 [Drosophila gunungcola]KAI8038525.1 hypothetical protein M5D96_008425 [Drosophila gunungcola]